MNNRNQGRHGRPAAQRRAAVYPFFWSAALFVAVAASVIASISFSVHPAIAAIIGVNTATFMLCGFDKGAAGANSLRVPEWVLLGTACLGGAPGLLVSMVLFRHKTKKPGFIMLTVLILVAQVWVVRLLGPHEVRTLFR